MPDDGAFEDAKESPAFWGDASAGWERSEATSDLLMVELNGSCRQLVSGEMTHARGLAFIRLGIVSASHTGDFQSLSRCQDTCFAWIVS